MKKDEIIERLRNDEDYYGDYGNKFLSNSHIGKLLKNPMSLYDKTPDNPNFKIGGYFHTAILEPDKLKSFKIIDASNTHGKAAAVAAKPKPKITVEQFNKAKDYLKNGGKLEAIKTKYTLTSKQEEQLAAL